MTKCQEALGISAYSIQIIATDLKEIQELNQKFRDKDMATDVISFTYADLKSKPSVGTTSTQNPQPGSSELGDIFICMEKTESQAADIGQSLSAEFTFLCIHGLLHLCGYDHIEPEEERKMISQQQKLIELLKDSGSYPENFIRVKGSHA